MTESFLLMSFGTTENGSVHLRIPKAKPDLMAAEASSAMSIILHHAGIKTKSGLINSIQSATLRQVVTTPISVD